MSWFSRGYEWVSNKVGSASELVTSSCRASANAVSSAFQTWRHKPFTQLFRSFYTLATTGAIAIFELGMVELIFREAACDVHARVVHDEPISEEFNQIVSIASYATIAGLMGVFIVPRVLNNWTKSDIKNWPMFARSDHNQGDDVEQALLENPTTCAQHKWLYGFSIMAWTAYVISFSASRIKNFEATSSAFNVFFPINEEDNLPLSVVVTVLLGLSSALFNVPEFAGGLAETKRYLSDLSGEKLKTDLMGNKKILALNVMNLTVAISSGMQSVVWVERFMARLQLPFSALVSIKSATALSATLSTLLTNMKASNGASGNWCKAARQHKLLLVSVTAYSLVWLLLNNYLIKKSVMDFAFPHEHAMPANSTSLSDTCESIALSTQDHEEIQRIIYPITLLFGSIFSFVSSSFLLKKYIEIIENMFSSAGDAHGDEVLINNYEASVDDDANDGDGLAANGAVSGSNEHSSLLLRADNLNGRQYGSLESLKGNGLLFTPQQSSNAQSERPPSVRSMSVSRSSSSIA